MWPFTSKYPAASLTDIASREYDFIVVGGGTSGCALASRLSEDPNVHVLLLERGPAITSWMSRVPLLSMDFRRPSSPAYKWISEPLAAVNQLTNKIVSGKAFGGTSKINASVYHRSVPGEYNAWARLGLRGWNWSDVEPLFNKSETSLSHGHLSHRGTSGPWKNRKPDNYFAHNLVIPKACTKIGLQYVDSANDPAAPSACCTRLEVTLDEDGLRQSSFDAFLPPALAKERVKNLTICPGVMVTSVAFSRAEGSLRASGVTVEAEKPGGVKVSVSARREVILCAGAIGTPHLLLLSGVGPASHLREHNVEVILDLPVGSHLQDHAGVALMYKFPKQDTLHAAQDSPWLLIRECFRFMSQGTGLFLAPNPQLSIFAVSQKLDDVLTTTANADDLDPADPSNVPDIEIMPIPFNARDPEFKDKLSSKEGGFSFLCVALRPTSEGTVRLRSAESRVPPVCDLGTFTDAAGKDIKVARTAIRLALRIAREMEAQGHVMPPLNVPKSETEEDLDFFIKSDVQSTYHYSSSCRMSADPSAGVVDDELRVHGIGGLRICDASVFPQIPACHLQAPAVMLAERCAVLLK